MTEIVNTPVLVELQPVNGTAQPVTTSLRVAEYFEKNHRDVLRGIKETISKCSESFNERNFALVDYMDEKGEKRPMYQLTRDGFMMVAMGRPIYVSSGYRSPKLNTAVGGASTSHHLTGCAADIRFNRSEQTYNDADLFDYVYRHLPYTELIAEGIPSGWVHVAYDPARADKAVKYMIASAGTVHKSSYDKIMALYRQYGMVPKR